MRKVLLLAVLFQFSLCYSQVRKEWTQLSEINNDPDHPFQAQNDFTGSCFIVLNDRFDYYKTPLILKQDGKEILKISFSESAGLSTTFMGTAFDPEDSLPSFRPWYYNHDPDYLRLIMECTDTAGAFYKVRLTKTDYAFISKRNKDFKKVNAPLFVRKWTTSGFDFNRSENPLRDTPSENAGIIHHNEENKFPIWTAQSLEVKDDWLKIVTIRGEEGWIRWRQGDKFLIKMYFEL
jgi:hypothetical protein